MVTPAQGTTARDAALAMLERQARKRIRPRSLSGDKGYHTRDFVQRLRARGVQPHIATMTNRHTPGLDRRTTQSPAYAVSQRLRKKIEEVFGWAKTVGGLRKTRFVGRARTELHALLSAPPTTCCG